MTRMVRFTSPGQVEVIDADDPVPGPGEVRLETLFSGISAGTELTVYRGSNPYLSRRWDPDTRLFVEGATHAYPLDGWGYEEVGRVVAAGSEAEQDLVGRLAWGAWGHRSTAVRPADYVRPRCLPEEGSAPIVAVFAKIGAIALNAVLDADIHVGEHVVVFGAGVPGQIAAQLARLNGARVTVVDLIAERRALAERLGAERVLDPTQQDVAGVVKAATGGRGADVVIEMSGSHDALHEAIRTAAYSSRVVAAGFFQGGGARLRLGDEFHHNRIDIVGSQISGVAPRLQHRWDELRMSTTVLELERQGHLDLRSLVTHVVDAEEAAGAFAMLDTAPEQALQIVLDYGGGG